MEARPRVVALVQARMGSTRLPGKVLADIAGRPMLWRVVDRVRGSRTVESVAVVTSDQAEDEAIAALCAEHGFECFRGSEADVLDRFYQAARRYGADAVVRITGDCPLADPAVIDKVVGTFIEGNYDYVSNTLRCTYPDGLDVEVFSFAALETAWREARLPAEREHVTPYIRTCCRFRLGNVDADPGERRPTLRLTVDEPDDLDRVRSVYARLADGGKHFGTAEILSLLVSEPGLAAVGAAPVRNEGYYQSLTREEPRPARPAMLTRSLELRARAERVIPSCTQTFSKGPSQFVQGVAPVFLVRGRGSHVWDADGNEYIDYPMALGPVILGHNHPVVTEAVKRQMEDGVTFSLPHPLEIEVAEMLVELIPCAEMVRFGKNGSDATTGAVRAARAYTGRDIVACCGYHGWQDWYIGTTTRSLGVPRAVRELTVPFEYNDIASLQRVFAEHPGQVAAVIMEPVGVVEPAQGFLPAVRDLTAREGALLIFDEVVTGFRLAEGGAQELFGVTPDLACFGKAMANGYPISAVVGPREIMRVFDEVFFSFTFGGEILSLAAARATIRELRARKVIAHLWEQGRRLQEGYTALARAYGIESLTRCVGLAPRTVAMFGDGQGQQALVQKSLFQQECLRRGILFAGGHNLCWSHSEADIDETLRVYRTAMEILADALRRGDAGTRLEGEPLRPVFRRA